MKVFEKELYHIHRDNLHNDNWIVGNFINTPEKGYNYFYNGIICEPQQKVSINFNQYDLIKYLGDNLDSFYDFNNKTLKIEKIDEYTLINLKYFNSHIISVLNNTFDSLLNSRKVLRETLFENIRQASYPDLPSRQKCFWLCELLNIETWWEDFKDNENKSIFKISATGNLFKADGSHIQLDIFKLIDFISSAELYWKGANKSSEINLPELLFEGSLKIIAKYDNPSQIKNGS